MGGYQYSELCKTQEERKWHFSKVIKCAVQFGATRERLRTPAIAFWAHSVQVMFQWAFDIVELSKIRFRVGKQPMHLNAFDRLDKLNSKGGHKRWGPFAAQAENNAVTPG